MTNRWLACGLMLQFAVWGSQAYGGDCGRPYHGTCAAPSYSYAAPTTYSYAAPTTYSYAAPTTYSYAAPSYSYAAPMTYSYSMPVTYAAPVAAPQVAQAQVEPSCAGEASAQGFFLSSVLPLVLPRLIDRLFPSPPDAPPVGDRSRLDRIEERLDRIEAKIGISRSGNGSLDQLEQNPNRPFGAAQSGKADQDAARQIMQGLSEIQTQLTGMHVSLSRNTATMQKIEGFLGDKYGNEFKNYTPPAD